MCRSGFAFARPRATARPSGRPTAKPIGKPAAEPTATKVEPMILERAKTHVIRPAHVQGIVCDEGVSAQARRIKRTKKITARRWARKLKPTLNVEAFGPALHAKLAGAVTGYAWQLRKNGVPVHTGIWEWSQRPSDAGEGWSLDTRMHIASVSKLITAMATAHVLKYRNMKYTDLVHPYLPEYWTRGPKVEDITFRHLLTHMSGFSTGSSDSDFGFMKARVAAGVAGKFNSYDYENMNFGLCRILIPVLFGWIKATDAHGDATDTIWDVRTTTRFAEYCQTRLFTPSGVSGVGFEPQGTRALAYTFPPGNSNGWNSGDLTTVSGGAGFRMSVNEVLNVMGTFRRSGKILSPTEAQTFLDTGLGIDQIIDTDAGKLYNKNGRWQNSGRAEQAVAFFMPDDMELVLFVNSPIANDASLRDAVTDTYIANLG